jgi:formylglycine-generating enzyme required for sulfatase activity
MVHFPRDPEHGVYHPFWIDTTEVTVEMYGKTAKKVYNPVLSKMPQIIQTQEELDSYFKSINTGFTDIGFRLPYQEEWLRAFRKPDGRKLCYWGEEMHQDIVKSYAWYNLNAKASDWSSPHAEIDGVQNVAQLLPNAYGLYDMSGNAAELLRIKRSPSYYVYFTNEAWYAEGVIGGDAYSSVEKLVPEHYPDSKFKGFRKVYGQYF